MWCTSKGTQTLHCSCPALLEAFSPSTTPSSQSRCTARAFTTHTLMVGQLLNAGRANAGLRFRTRSTAITVQFSQALPITARLYTCRGLKKLLTQYHVDMIQQRHP